MKAVFSIFLAGVISLLSACVPSYHRLLQYEELSKIQEIGILVEMPMAFSEADTMSALYAKYGYERRAERIAEERKKQEIWIKTAFLEKFSFCKVYFNFDSLPTDIPYYHLRFFESEKLQDYRDRGTLEMVLSLELFSVDPQRPLAPEFPSLVQSNGKGYNLQNYRYLVKQLQTKLETQEKQKQRLLEKKL